jgi:hypothetical protein
MSNDRHPTPIVRCTAYGSFDATESGRPTAEQAISFVVCSSDEIILKANLLASPCLTKNSCHEDIAIRNAPSAAAGLRMGITRSSNKLIACVHQDVFLPAGWDRLILKQYLMAERLYGPSGVAGVYGVGPVANEPDDCYPDLPYGLTAKRIGWVEDRGTVRNEGPGLPAAVATLDELLLVVRKDTPLRFDPELGFHLYGADLCLQAHEHGLAVVALGAPCRHNSRSVGLLDAFFASAKVFARKWAHRLPIATPCVVFDQGGELRLLGNADKDNESIARSVAPVPGSNL